jgi:hypothetical protein
MDVHILLADRWLHLVALQESIQRIWNQNDQCDRFDNVLYVMRSANSATAT